MTEEEALNTINSMIIGTDMVSNALRGLGRCSFKIALDEGKTIEESFEIALCFTGEKLLELVESINLKSYDKGKAQ